MANGVQINFTSDGEASIIELHEFNEDLNNLRKKYPFIKDWELNNKRS